MKFKMMSNMNKIHSKKVLGWMGLLLMTLSLWLLASCYDDKGNYDYTELEEVVVEQAGDRIQEQYIVSRFDTLTLDPKVLY